MLIACDSVLYHRAWHVAGSAARLDLRAGRVAFVEDAPLVRCDVGDGGAVKQALGRYGPFDGVLHFAAYLVVPESLPCRDGVPRPSVRRTTRQSSLETISRPAKQSLRISRAT